LLDMAHPYGYRPIAIAHPHGWQIAAGCHWFNVQQALAHWGPTYIGDPEIARRYRRAISELPPCPYVAPRRGNG